MDLKLLKQQFEYLSFHGDIGLIPIEPWLPLAPSLGLSSDLGLLKNEVMNLAKAREIVWAHVLRHLLVSGEDGAYKLALNYSPFHAVRGLLFGDLEDDTCRVVGGTIASDLLTQTGGAQAFIFAVDDTVSCKVFVFS